MEITWASDAAFQCGQALEGDQAARSHVFPHSAVSLVTMWKVLNDYTEAWRLPETTSMGLLYSIKLLI